MSYTHSVAYGWSSGAASPISGTISQTGDGEDHRTLVIPNATDGQLVNISWLNANLKSLFILSDRAVTFFSNVDGGAGNDTVVLVGGTPVVFQASTGQVNPFATADVTKLYVDNASGSQATIEIRVLVDSTP